MQAGFNDPDFVDAFVRAQSTAPYASYQVYARHNQPMNGYPQQPTAYGAREFAFALPQLERLDRHCQA